MQTLWTLGGLSFPALLRRTLHEAWRDEVFGQGGRMAFYQFLAIFPSLLLLFMMSPHVAHAGGQLGYALKDFSRQVLPEQVSQLLQELVSELSRQNHSRLQLVSLCAGALWAALNGTWAMIFGLNKAYEVEERRSWLQIAVTIVGLTVALVGTAAAAAMLFFASAYVQSHIHSGAIALHAMEWLVLGLALAFSFAVLYRFAPNLRDHEWRWSTPGALCALVLWIGATLLSRLYFEHVNDYARSYGHLNGVVILLLWLYVSNGAILIGGEMNSEIEKAVAAGDKATRGEDSRRSRSG